jgi:hypothetical protein
MVCTFILPPDGCAHEIHVSQEDTVQNAIDLVQGLFEPSSPFQICDGDSHVLSRATLLRTLPEPRDLFVQYCVVREIARRSGLDFVREPVEVLPEATIADLIASVAGRFGDCKFANEFGQILSSDALIREINGAIVAVPSTSQRVLDVQIYDVELGSLEVDCEAKVSDFIHYQKDLLGVVSLASQVVDDDGLIGADKFLGTVRGVLRCIPVVDSPRSDSRPSNPRIPSVDGSPDHRASSDAGPPVPPSGGNCPDLTYTFQYNDEKFELSIPRDGKVLQAKQQIADLYNSIADNVSLFFCSRNLRDECVLSRQRIGTGKIIVYIRAMERILLESIGYESL